MPGTENDVKCVWRGEWIAKSKDELARPCIGYSGKAGPQQHDFGGIQTYSDGLIRPTVWSAEVPTAQDAQEHSFEMVDKWLGKPGPKLREATIEEIRTSQEPSSRIFALMSGKHPLPSYEEYQAACAAQRAGFGAKVPGRGQERAATLPKRKERSIDR